MERYIVMRILLGLFLLFVIIFFVIRLAGGGDEPVPEEETPIEAPFILSDQVNSRSSVRFTIIGKTNAPEDHREFQFTISQNSRRVDLLGGYDGNIVRSMVLPNTIASYEQLLYALEAEGYTLEAEEPTVTDSRGQCSNGKQYRYTARVNGLTMSDLWSSSCSSRHGTFGGDRNDIVRLFERQFPDFNTFDNGVRL